jgi:hypothetical protein
MGKFLLLFFALNGEDLYGCLFVHTNLRGVTIQFLHFTSLMQFYIIIYEIKFMLDAMIVMKGVILG